MRPRPRPEQDEQFDPRYYDQETFDHFDQGVTGRMLKNHELADGLIAKWHKKGGQGGDKSDKVKLFMRHGWTAAPGRDNNYEDAQVARRQLATLKKTGDFFEVDDLTVIRYQRYHRFAEKLGFKVKTLKDRATGAGRINRTEDIPNWVPSTTKRKIKPSQVPLSDRPIAAGQKFVDKIMESKESQFVKDLLAGLK
jgi:hypothetical protein